MRNLILEKIQELKQGQSDFETPQWDDFFFGHLHISVFTPAGIPTDEMLLDFYCELMDWHYKCLYTGKPPMIENTLLEQLKVQRVNNLTSGSLSNDPSLKDDCCAECGKPMNIMEHNYGMDGHLCCIHCYELAQTKI